MNDNSFDRAGDDRAARLGLGVGLPIAIVAIAYVPFLVVRSDLPDRVATHFDLGGRPDGSMTVAAFLVVTGILVAIGIGICIVASRRRAGDGSLAATAGFLGGFLGGMGAGIVAATSVSQRGLTDWQDADGAGWMVLVALVIATALGVIGARLAAKLEIDAREPSDVVPAMALSRSEEVVWATTVRSTPMLLAGWSGVLLGIAIALVASWPIGIIVIVAGMPVLALATLHVRADRTGLHIRYGHLPWPTTAVDVARIEQATAIDVRPTEWGGWGYRGSLKLMRRAAVVLRAGPGIRLDLVDDKTFVVTVDEPQDAVAVLNAQIERQAAAS